MGCCASSGIAPRDDVERRSNYYCGSDNLSSCLSSVDFDQEPADLVALTEKLERMEGFGEGKRAPSDGLPAVEPSVRMRLATLFFRGLSAKIACRDHEMDEEELRALGRLEPRRSFYMRWWLHAQMKENSRPELIPNVFSGEFLPEGAFSDHTASLTTIETLSSAPRLSSSSGAYLKWGDSPRLSEGAAAAVCSPREDATSEAQYSATEEEVVVTLPGMTRTPSLTERRASRPRPSEVELATPPTPLRGTSSVP